MSVTGVIDPDFTPVPTFANGAAGLWAAIVDKIALGDPAGSWPAGPSWPGRPVVAEPGMFDLSER